MKEALQKIGLQPHIIEVVNKENPQEEILQALNLTKEGVKEKKVNNPAGFFMGALNGKWKGKEQAEKPAVRLNYLDLEVEKNIRPENWREVRGHFAKVYGVAVFNSWVKELKHLKEENHTVYLSAKTQFVCDWVSNHYTRTLERYWFAVTGKKVTVRIIYTRACPQFVFATK